MPIRSNPKRATSLAPIVGAMVGASAAVVFAILPVSPVQGVMADGTIALICASPALPLSFTVQLLLVVFGGGTLGAIAWLTTFLLLRAADAPIAGKGFVMERAARDKDDWPIPRRADGHPDTPPMTPLRADRDLGTWLLDVPSTAAPSGQPVVASNGVNPWMPAAGQAVPDDLDDPLPADDPRKALDPTSSEHTSEAEITPVKADPAATIHALLDQLEHVVQRAPVGPAEPPGPAPVAPPPTPSPGGFADTLAELRALALRAR